MLIQKKTKGENTSIQNKKFTTLEKSHTFNNMKTY